MIQWMACRDFLVLKMIARVFHQRYMHNNIIERGVKHVFTLCLGSFGF